MSTELKACVDPTDSELEALYNELSEWRDVYLSEQVTSMPKLKNGNVYGKNALVLIYLYKNSGVAVHKTTLTNFMKKHFPEINDVQQARHLAAQNGWPILSGTRGDVSSTGVKLSEGEYLIETLDTPYSRSSHRITKLKANSFDELKKEYNNACATCKSKEGQFHSDYTSAIVKLQQGHMDPDLPLVLENCIPQCQFCNRSYQNKYKFDKTGMVKSPARFKVVEELSEEQQKLAYEYLKKKFNP